MNKLNFSRTITKLRHERNITQEELAAFVGVTKASVSKWETAQSLPDILLLPVLASFFDISIDELIGYEPQLSKEQIRKFYHTLAADFAVRPFEAVMEESRKLVKKYYSCYPFLLQMGILWLNHAPLADNENRRLEILNSASKLCSHIIDCCKEVGVSSDAFMLKAILDLQCGRTAEVIEALEENYNPNRMAAQEEYYLIQAYQMAGESQKARQYTQISIYNHLLSLINCLIQYLIIHADSENICNETLRRADQLSESFHLAKLNPSLSANLQYAAAIVYCTQNRPKEALERLKRYVTDVRFLLKDENIKLYGDTFFDEIDVWFDELELGSDAPRNRDIVKRSISENFSHPAFAILKQYKEFQIMKKGEPS